jgi:hypothetical protein
MKCMNNIPYHEFVTHRVANSKSHQDSGQMDRDVRMADSLTIDSILCSEKNYADRRYSILHEQKLIFASKDILYLHPEKLGLNILMERRLIEEGVS